MAWPNTYWGHAKDYVLGMWLMLQQDLPQDFVLATGRTHSVRDFVNTAFAHLGVVLSWEGSGHKLKAIDPRSSSVAVELDQQLQRPVEVHHLLGDSTKARKVLGWKAEIQFEELVGEMVDSEMQRLQNTLS